MSVKLTNDQSVQTLGLKLTIIAIIGLLAGVFATVFIRPIIGPLVGWDTTAVVYVAVTWYQVLKFGPEIVKKHALREDPSRVITNLTLLIASLASLAAVAVLLASAKQTSGGAEVGLAFLGVLSVVASWLMVHTLFALRYAELYYTRPEGGVDFGDTTTPIYSDFAYLAFTLGMTFQVSDTTLKAREFRGLALRHALLSYLLGTVIIATTINLVAGLSK